MSAQKLITEHLDLWTGAVTKKSSSGRGNNGKVELTGIKKLRELILELAVRGKLVEQDSTEEPASMLLKQVTVEKAQLAKEGKIKKPKKLLEIDEKEKPFDLPVGWQWARMEAISEYIQRGKGPKYAGSGKVKVVSQKCVQWSGFDLKAARFVDDSSLGGYQEERYIRENDILWNSTGTGTVGRAIVVEKQQCSIVADSHVTIIRPLVSEPRHVLNYISSPSVQQRIEPDHENSLVSGSTKQVELNSTSVKMLAVPLPPLNEQHRIVQKVDELMALCDRLEQQTSEHLEAHETLVDTLLGTLTQSENVTELADNWARLTAHFDTLLTTEQSIDKLKQTILQLAVMGRLVEQEAEDMPAGRLLERIDEEIASLVNQGRIKKPKRIPPVAESGKFYEIPESWQWVRLGNIALQSEAGWSPKCHDTPRENQNWAVLKVSAVTWGQFRPDENKELPNNLPPRPEYEVQPSDFLISRANTSELVARSVVVPEGVPEKLMMSDKIIRVVFSKQVVPLYLNLFNNSRCARNYYLSVAGGTSSSMKNVSRAQIQGLPVPLPPKAEQYRIVQKVDELMALCDQLQARLNKVSETRCYLADAVVEKSLG